ncbi:peptidyl-prolyl cis-trans isomerase [Ureibacillus acetophenoni]|uniref:peptidylprolyl isomerase n=1 Tax=Ureibacillus acetophenoni TaxID=614649 RepID=A0A285USC7_9BACL|nr:peptidyl-prolyl cis-trans isomerase [Ureibacillus acetophenoni]SOC44815.1 foldase protein PrsA [Ureibacillus acetophenoni]
MKYRSTSTQTQHRPTTMENKTPISKRRLKTKPTLIVMFILLVGNIFWFILWILGIGTGGNGGDEIVATVDGEEITRQQWMATMESQYGKETLHSMVNDAVMERAAKEYDITVTDGEIDLEIALMSSTKDLDTSLKIFDEQQTRQKIRAQLILEKVLTKDIVIEDSIIQEVYEENRSLYNTPTTYRTSIIVVGSLDEALQVQNELKNGSDFSLLARERSIDTSSSSLGGNIGYITASQSNIDSSIQREVQDLKADEISEPIALSNGNYGLLLVSEIIEGKSFKFEEVKDHIKTELAMEQLPTNVSTEMFWEEFNVTTYYLK